MLSPSPKRGDSVVYLPLLEWQTLSVKLNSYSPIFVWIVDDVSYNVASLHGHYGTSTDVTSASNISEDTDSFPFNVHLAVITKNDASAFIRFSASVSLSCRPSSNDDLHLTSMVTDLFILFSILNGTVQPSTVQCCISLRCTAPWCFYVINRQQRSFAFPLDAQLQSSARLLCRHFDNSRQSFYGTLYRGHRTARVSNCNSDEH